MVNAKRMNSDSVMLLCLLIAMLMIRSKVGGSGSREMLCTAYFGWSHLLILISYQW